MGIEVLGPSSSHKSAHIVVFVANVEEEVAGRAGRAAAMERCQHAGQARTRAAWAEEDLKSVPGRLASMDGADILGRSDCARALQPRVTQMIKLLTQRARTSPDNRTPTRHGSG